MMRRSVNIQGQASSRDWRARTVCLLASLLVTGCGDQTGVPQPEPVPRVSLLRATSADGPGEIELLGLPGAVPAAGTLSVVSSAGTATTSTTSVGTFALAVTIATERSITLRYEGHPPVQFALPTGGPPAVERSFAMPLVGGDTITFTVPAPEGSIVVVANFSNGIVVQERAGQGGAQVTIAAGPGDELHVYVDGEALSVPVVFTLS